VEQAMAVAIQTESLDKTYGSAKAVTDFSLSVPTGQVLGLLGSNGAGKTTLLKMIAGLLAPDAGSVHLNGYDLARERDNALQQVTAIVQGVCPLDERRSIWQNLSPVARVGAAPLLYDFELWAGCDDPVSDLPHGFRQRAVLACALGAGSPILLLDEPMLGLDARAARTAKAWIERLAREQGKTILVATCRLQLAQEIGDRIVVMKNGCRVADVLVSKSLGLSMPASYRIKVKGVLDARWATWFDGLTMTATQDETILSGPVADQPALHSLLIRIRDLGLPLVSVNRIEPDLEALLFQA
jgi:ABC-2 type transport system ATP-binding protein